MADRPTTEPRTEAGRALIERTWLAAGTLNAMLKERGITDIDLRDWRPDREEVARIEAEAAQGAAPRAEGLPSVEALTAALAYADRTDDDPSRWYSGEVGYMDYEDHARAVLVGLSVYKDRQDGGNRPRAEGLDVERLGQVIYEMGVDDLDLPDAQKFAAHIAARLSRPSDERVPESEECKRFRHDEHCDH